jgi:hypothetical protein
MKTHSSIEPSCEPHDAATPILERQLRVGIGRDVQHREIVGDERIDEAAGGERDEQELPGRERSRQSHPDGDAALRTCERQRGEQRRQQQGEYQREVSELGNHRASFASWLEVWWLCHRRA